MRRKQFFLVCGLLVLGLILGFGLGHWFPVRIWQPEIEVTKITLNEYLTRRIQSIAAIATFAAAFIALFKEEIRKLWERAELSVCLKDGRQLHEMLDGEASGTAQGLKAKKYVSVLLVENKGRLPAKTCEVMLERLQFKGDSFANAQDIEVSGTPIRWTNPSRDTVVVPGTGRSYLTLAEIHSPSSQPVVANEEATTVTYPTLTIGGTNLPKECMNGLFTATFKIYSENARPIEVTCTLKWTSGWEPRLTEMIRHVTITVDSKKL